MCQVEGKGMWEREQMEDIEGKLRSEAMEQVHWGVCVWVYLVLQGGKKWPCFALGIKSRLFSWTSKALVNWLLSASLAILPPILSIVCYTQPFTSTASVSTDSTNCISKMLFKSFQKSPKNKTWIFPALATIYTVLGNPEMI